MKINKTPRENTETHEKLKIQIDNNANHEKSKEQNTKQITTQISPIKTRSPKNTLTRYSKENISPYS